MKITTPIPQVALLEFSSQKEMALTMCRWQEHYESRDPELYGRLFSVETFLDRQMAADGQVEYFSFWAGFNVPGDAVLRFMHQPTAREFAAFNLLKGKVSTDAPFYVIAVREGDTETLAHELAHARYYVDAQYRSRMQAEMETWPEDVAAHVDGCLRKLGYSDSVIVDERHAWVMTSSEEELTEAGMDAEAVAPYRARLVALRGAE